MNNEYSLYRELSQFQVPKEPPTNTNTMTKERELLKEAAELFQTLISDVRYAEKMQPEIFQYLNKINTHLSQLDAVAMSWEEAMKVIYSKIPKDQWLKIRNEPLAAEALRIAEEAAHVLIESNRRKTEHDNSTWEDFLNEGALTFNYKSFWHMLRYGANQDLPVNIVDEIKKASFKAARLFMESNRVQSGRVDEKPKALSLQDCQNWFDGNQESRFRNNTRLTTDTGYLHASDIPYLLADFSRFYVHNSPCLETQWIPVKERLPEFNTAVLVWCNLYGRYIGSYMQIDNTTYGNWHDGKQLGVLPPIFWQPLPEAPGVYLEGNK